ncbi:MAG: putative porin, partial [Bacteroidota bacterium]|nr:putative porin [Bacteroidota bacterium]
GFYQQQKTDTKNFIIYAQYYTKNRRYGVLANYIHNKVYVEENGGITNDITFEENLESNREVYAVNLYSAENQTKDNSFFINQYFNISRHPSKSSGPNLGRLTYSFHQFKQTQKYLDGDPAGGFYENIYLDSTNTLDSVYYYKIENQLTWSSLSYDDTLLQRPLYVYLGVRQRYIELAGYMPKAYFRQWSPVAGLRYSFLKFYHASASASYTIGDYNGDDYYGRFALGRWFGNDSTRRGEIAFIAEISHQAPGYFYQEYRSNNFIWSNNFGKQNYLMAEIYIRWQRFNVGFTYYELNNYVALGPDAIPFQFDGTFNVLRAFLYKDFKIRRFNIIGKLTYQQASNIDVIKLPDLLAYISFLYTTPIFKAAATIQPGIDIYYATSYYANGYMPALRSFNLQMEKQIGNYPFVDLYFMIRIKRARLFLKYQNLSGLFGNYTYYTVPHYPMNDPSFKFGISWKFFD